MAYSEPRDFGGNIAVPPRDYEISSDGPFSAASWWQMQPETCHFKGPQPRHNRAWDYAIPRGYGEVDCFVIQVNCGFQRIEAPWLEMAWLGIKEGRRGAIETLS